MIPSPVAIFEAHHYPKGSTVQVKVAGFGNFTVATTDGRFWQRAEWPPHETIGFCENWGSTFNVLSNVPRTLCFSVESTNLSRETS